MEFKKTRVKQIITAIRTVKDSFKQLEEEQQDNIKDFNMMSNFVVFSYNYLYPNYIIKKYYYFFEIKY